MNRWWRRRSFLVALFLGGGLLFALTSGIRSYALQTTVPKGVTLSGMKIGGMPQEEFELVLGDTLSLLGHQQIRLASDVPSVWEATLTLHQLGITPEADELIEKLRNTHSGPLFQRAIARWRLKHSQFSLHIHLDETKLRQTVEQTWAALLLAQPVDAKRIITKQDTVQLVPEVNAYSIDMAQLAANLKKLLPIPLWSVQMLRQSIQLELPVIARTPKLTLEMLQKQRIERKISEFTTTYPPGSDGRTHNIVSSAATIHDMLLAPGDVFDYSEVIKQTEKTFGFREAPVILNGKLVPGIGGGICQVSSTLYNAVLRGGLEIVERRNHTLPVSYVALGQDATFATDYINFRFRNNTDHHLLIRTASEKNRMTVKLFGYTPAEITYGIESVILKQLPPPVKYVKNSALRPGAQQIIQQGKPGYVVETHRTKRENGIEIAKELVSRDTYSPEPTIIATKLGEDAAPPSPGALPPSSTPPPLIIEDGVRGPNFR